MIGIEWQSFQEYDILASKGYILNLDAKPAESRPVIFDQPVYYNSFVYTKVFPGWRPCVSLKLQRVFQGEYLLRMLNFTVGAEVMRRAMVTYLRTYGGATATHEQLWKEISTVRRRRR